VEPSEIRAALDDILTTVQMPARYLGLERNQVRKPWGSVAVRVAFAFPDAYEIGMSHFGSQLLYHLVNRRQDALAERAYCPMPDMAAAMRRRGIPLYTHETYRQLRDFDVVGISLQSELNYVNLPYLLDLAAITRRAVDREEHEPLVLGGGPCTANPEPVADFFDAILIGDAEVGLDPLLDAVRQARHDRLPRSALLESLAALRGVYVPSLYRWTPPRPGVAGGWEGLAPAARLPVSRVFAEELDPALLPPSPLLPVAEVVQNRLGLEIMRGCTHGCRFCQAGYWYRPVRELPPRAVLDYLLGQVEESGAEEVGLLSLSTADYSQVERLVRDLALGLEERRVSVSLPSLRADALSLSLAEAVSRVRKSGFTFAPETGSDRLRRVINKGMTSTDVVRSAEAAFAKGWNLVKVYAMVGLPTETDEDLEALVDLAQELAAAGRRIRSHRAQVKVAVASFIPKPWTPFQWQPFGPLPELERRMQVLRERLRRASGVRLVLSNPRQSALEALLARGDRSLAATIERAHDLGAVFDGWSDHLDLEAWRRAIADTGVDLERELGPRSMDQLLPWDVVDAGVRKSFLKAEWRRAMTETVTPDCRRGECLRCGIPGDGDDIRLTPQVVGTGGSDVPAPAATAAAAPHARGDRSQPPVFRRYRCTFAKRGHARYLSHRQVMGALERALRAADVPTRYTEGFNPHIRLSMGPALAVGHEGLAELFDVDCTAPLRDNHVHTSNRFLPEGLELVGAQDLVPGAKSLGKMVAAGRYRIACRTIDDWERRVAGAEAALGVSVRRWSVDKEGSLCVELNLRQGNGPTGSIKGLLAELGVGPDELALCRVTRELLLLETPPPETRP